MKLPLPLYVLVAVAYDYGDSPQRHFITSAGAHNVAGPTRDVLAFSGKRPFKSYVDDARVTEKNTGVAFDARRRFGAQTLLRTVTVPADEPSLVVDDSLSGRTPMIMLWNLGPEVLFAEPDTSAFDAIAWYLHKAAGRTFRLAVSQPGEPVTVEASIEHGASSPMLGWYSPRFGSIVEAGCIALRFRAEGAARLRTEITLIDDPAGK